MLFRLCHRTKAEVIADLAMRRRHSALSLAVPNELKNVALSFGQIGHFRLVKKQCSGNNAKVKRVVSESWA